MFVQFGYGLTRRWESGIVSSSCQTSRCKLCPTQRRPCERLLMPLFMAPCRSSGPDTDVDESIDGGSHAADQSFSGGLSTTDFEGASLEVCLA